MSLPLKQVLAENKEAIVREWFTRTLETYPAQTFRFLLNDKDPFRNPVGQTLKEGLAGLFEQLVNGSNLAQTEQALDGIIRIRAVQDFSAAQAVSFVFFVKEIIRKYAQGGLVRDQNKAEALHENRRDAQRKGRFVVEEQAELPELEQRIDEMALLAFDLFMKCREKIYEIKADEVKRKLYLQLRSK